MQQRSAPFLSPPRENICERSWNVFSLRERFVDFEVCSHNMKIQNRYWFIFFYMFYMVPLLYLGMCFLYLELARNIFFILDIQNITVNCNHHNVFLPFSSTKLSLVGQCCFISPQFEELWNFHEIPISNWYSANWINHIKRGKAKPNNWYNYFLKS